jgi:hypothetical protein
VIIEGAVELAIDDDDEFIDRVSGSYEAKYGFRHPPPFWRLRPRVAFAWTDFSKNPTRWRF